MRNSADGHQGLDQPVEQELARHRLRHADYGREVEVIERGFNGREVRLGETCGATSGWCRSSWATLADAPQRR